MKFSFKPLELRNNACAFRTQSYVGQNQHARRSVPPKPKTTSVEFCQLYGHGTLEQREDPIFAIAALGVTSLTACGCAYTKPKGVHENLHPRGYLTREKSTRATHAWTCEGGPNPTPSPKASQLPEKPLGRERGTENLPGVPKRPLC